VRGGREDEGMESKGGEGRGRGQRYREDNQHRNDSSDVYAFCFLYKHIVANVCYAFGVWEL